MNNRKVDMQTDTTSLKPSDTKNPLDAPPEPKNWWETKLEGRKLAVMWFLTTIVGMLFISLTSGTPRLLIPILLLSTYAWYGYKYVESAGELVALRQARVGQLADSVYFLGFLWTLFALIDSLVIQKLSANEAVFRAFGYALVTTGTGMFLRLFLLQFGYSEEEQVRLAKQNVEEEISRFTKELTRGTESIRSFHAEINSLERSAGMLRTSVDKVSGQITDLTAELLKLHRDSLARLEEHTKNTISDIIRKFDLAELKNQLQSELLKVVSTLGDGVAKTTRSIETITKKFTDTVSTQIEKLQSSLQNVSNQIAQIRVAPDIVEKTVGEQVANITATLVESSKAVQEAMTRLSEQIATVRVPADIVEKTLTEQLAKVTSQLAEATVTFQEAITQLSGQIRSVRVPSDIVEKIVMEQVTTATAGLSTSTEALKGAINKLEKSFVTMADHVRTIQRIPWWKKFWR